jgi:hypothetical protein
MGIKMMKKTMSSPAPLLRGACLHGQPRNDPGVAPSQHVEQIKQDDDRNGDADQPQ